MNKQLAPAAAIVAALLAGAAMPAAAQVPSGQQAGETYNRLHPKLGIVKVDRATGAMVRSQRTSDAQVDGRTQQTKYWLDPKGNVRVIKTPAADEPQGASTPVRN